MYHVPSPPFSPAAIFSDMAPIAMKPGPQNFVHTVPCAINLSTVPLLHNQIVGNCCLHHKNAPCATKHIVLCNKNVPNATRMPHAPPKCPMRHHDGPGEMAPESPTSNLEPQGTRPVSENSKLSTAALLLYTPIANYPRETNSPYTVPARSGVAGAAYAPIFC